MVFSLKAKTNNNNSAGLIFTSKGIGLAIINHDLEAPQLLHAKLYPSSEADIPSTLAELVRQFELDTIPCNFVLNPDENQVLQVEAPNVSKQELPTALRWHVKDLVDYHIDDIVTDHITLASENLPLQVIATRKSLIQSRVDDLLAAKCNLVSIDIALQSARNLISTAKTFSNDDSIGLLNIWDHNSKICVLKANTPYISRLTNLGADAIPPSGDHSDIADTLAIELQRTFDYYESFSRQPSVSKLVIMTNGSVIYGLDDLLEQRLGVECMFISSNDFSDLNIDVQAKSQDMSDGCLMAIGGALRNEY